jgi:hypothetical protein
MKSSASIWTATHPLSAAYRPRSMCTAQRQPEFIGASNMGKIAKAAAENGHMIVDLTSSGWTPKPGKIKKLCETLEKLNLLEIDTVVIDPMSNSAYLGTDEDGLPIPTENSDEDGRYHEFADAEKCPLEAAPMGERTGRARLINLLSFFGSGESPPQDLTTMDGTSIWAGDGVHLTSNASRVAARKLMADLVSGGEEGEPANKRARLESVVPAPAPVRKKAAAMGQPPTSPPRPVLSPPPLWLSGQLAPSQ